jgi:hypothetical protein
MKKRIGELMTNDNKMREREREERLKDRTTKSERVESFHSVADLVVSRLVFSLPSVVL